MTIGQFHELAISLWQAGNINTLKRPDFREVDLLAEIARNSLMGQYLESHHDLMAEFYTPFIVDVKFDAVRNKKYSILPADFAKLKESFIMISPIQSEETQFIHTRQGDEWLFHGLEAENNEGQTSYKVESKKVWYRNIHPEISQVLMNMVASMLSLPDTAIFPIPQMFEQQILDYVLSKLQIQETVPLKAEDKP